MPIDEEWLDARLGQEWKSSVPPTCPLCGYNLTGLEKPRCPECGRQFTWKELRQHALEKRKELTEQRESVGEVRTAFVFGGAGLGLWGLGYVLSFTTVRFYPALAHFMSFVLGMMCLLLGMKLLLAARARMPEGFQAAPTTNPLMGILAVLAGLLVCGLSLGL